MHELHMKTAERIQWFLDLAANKCMEMLWGDESRRGNVAGTSSPVSSFRVDALTV
jgi:hypothetical protein